MGLTKLTTDEVIRDDETHLQNKGLMVRMPLMRTFGPFNATNKHPGRLRNQLYEPLEVH